MQTAIQDINIDDLPCPAFQRRISDWERWKDSAYSSARERLVQRPIRDGVGIRPETLVNDWRALERRAHELFMTYASFADAYWGSLKEASAHGRRAGGNGDVWMPDEAYDRVDVFYGETQSMTYTSLSTLVKESVGSPERRAHVLTGAALAEIRHLRERQDTWRGRMWAYKGAFVLAIEERLRTFVASRTTHHPGMGRCVPPCAFVFANDGRSYLVTSNENGHRFEWFGGTLFEDRRRNDA